MIHKSVIGLILAYQRLSAYWGPHCRYLPTCSEYARLSVLKHGLWLGVGKSISRILRCHPFSASGYDPA